MRDQLRPHPLISTFATYSLISGASNFLLLRLCERCAQDNAYLGQLFLGLLCIILGVVFGLLWLIAARREGSSGFAVGAIAGVAVGGVFVVLGSTRVLTPPALEFVELLLLIVGAAGTLAFAFFRR